MGNYEKIEREETFTRGLVSGLHFKCLLTDKRIIISEPNLILGLIPLGMNELSQPLSEVSLVEKSDKYNLIGFILGFLGIYGGLKLFQFFLPYFRYDSLEDWFFILLILLWIFFMILLILSSAQYSFIISNTAGQNLGTYTVSLFEKSRMEDFVNDLNAARVSYIQNVASITVLY